MKYINFVVIALVALIISSCETSKTSRKTAYPEFYKEKLSTVLIMPPINKTNKVEAKEFFFTTLNQPLCEKGYYVIPPYLSMEIFKNESAYDADIFIDKPVDKFANYFNADIVVFTIIHQWQKSAIGGSITVEVEYIAKSAKTNTVIYSRRGTMSIDTSVNSVGGGGLLGAVVNMAATAINTAMTPHVKAARACNAFTFLDLPAGHYNSSFENDSILKSGKPVFKARVKAN